MLGLATPSELLKLSSGARAPLSANKVTPSGPKR
jgi:hypothetical protein